MLRRSRVRPVSWLRLGRGGCGGLDWRLCACKGFGFDLRAGGSAAGDDNDKQQAGSFFHGEDLAVLLREFPAGSLLRGEIFFIFTGDELLA